MTGRPTAGIAKGSFSDTFLLVLVNTSESNAKKDDLVITMGTPEPTKGEISAKVKRCRLAKEIAEGGSSNSSFLVPVNTSEHSTKKDSPMITTNTSKPMEKVIFAKLVEKDKPNMRIFESSSSNSSDKSN